VRRTAEATRFIPSILTGSTILNSSKAACRSTSNDGPSERQNGLYSLQSQIYGKFTVKLLKTPFCGEVSESIFRGATYIDEALCGDHAFGNLWNQIA